MGKVPKPNIVWRGAHPNNFMSGRSGVGRDGRNSNHHVVGSDESAVLVFNNPSRGASSHLVITARADVAAWQCVDFNDTAFTDGNFESNIRSITMEHHGDWRFGYTNEQVIENSAKVVAWLRDNGLVNRPIRHRDVSTNGTVCPADLPVERIWNRATEIINHYNNVDNRPQWLKDRTAHNEKMFAQIDGLFLRNVETNQPYDARRWGINTDFEIGSTTVVNGHRYFITASSTGTNAPAGFLEGDVKNTVWTPPLQWNATTPRKMMSRREMRVINLDTSQPVGNPIPADTPIDVMTHTTFKGVEYYRSKSSTEKGLNYGLVANELKEIAIVPTPPVVIPAPQPSSPEWLDSIIDEPNRPMYVLRATPVVDLEHGRPYIDPKTNREIWFKAGDIIEQMSAHVVILDKTYRLTEFAYSKTIAGEWQKFANGINSNDLTTDPKATPIGTPANPAPVEEPEDDPANMPDVPAEPSTPQAPPANPPSSGSQYMEDLLKQNNTLLQKIYDLLFGWLNK